MATIIRIIGEGAGGGGDGRVPITRGFTNLGDPDLINYLGTRGETITFQNPALAGSIGVNAFQAHYYCVLLDSVVEVRQHVLCNQMGGASLLASGQYTSSTQTRTESNIASLIYRFTTEIKPTVITLHSSFNAATNNRFIPLHKFIIRGIKKNGEIITLFHADGNPGDYWQTTRPINVGETAEVDFTLTNTDWIEAIQIVPIDNNNPNPNPLGVPISQMKVYGELDTAGIIYGKNFGVESALMAINPDLWLPFDAFLDGFRVLDANNAQVTINRQDSSFNDESNTNAVMEAYDREMGLCCSFEYGALYWTNLTLSAIGGNGYTLAFWFKTSKNPAYKQAIFTISSSNSGSTSTGNRHFILASVNNAGTFQCDLDDNDQPVFVDSNWAPKYVRDTGVVVDDGQWHFATITVPPNGTAFIYLDGVQVDSFSYGAMSTLVPRLRPGWGNIGQGLEETNQRYRGRIKHLGWNNNRIWSLAEHQSVWNGFG